jgi:excisionase family DNA binding protein
MTVHQELPGDGKPRRLDSADDELVPLLNMQQVSELLSIGKRKVWELTNCHDLTSVRIGRALRYRAQDVQAFIEKHRDCRRPRHSP